MTETENDAPAKKPVPRLLGNRSVVVPLTYPVEYGDRTISEITITRMNGAQVVDFMNAVQENASGAHLPMFDVPQEVVDALDADDAEAIDKAVFDFLPRRLRQAGEQILKAGAATSQ